MQRTDTNQRRVRANALAAVQTAKVAPPGPWRRESRVCWTREAGPWPQGTIGKAPHTRARVPAPPVKLSQGALSPRLPNPAAAPAAPSCVQCPDVPPEPVSGPRLQLTSGARRTSETLAQDLGRHFPALSPLHVPPRRRQSSPRPASAANGLSARARACRRVAVGISSLCFLIPTKEVWGPQARAAAEDAGPLTATCSPRPHVGPLLRRRPLRNLACHPVAHSVPGSPYQRVQHHCPRPPGRPALTLVGLRRLQAPSREGN